MPLSSHTKTLVLSQLLSVNLVTVVKVVAHAFNDFFLFEICKTKTCHYQSSMERWIYSVNVALTVSDCIISARGFVFQNVESFGQRDGQSLDFPDSHWF